MFFTLAKSLCLELAADELKKRLESVDGENKILTRRSSIDTSNFPKEILRDQRRRSSTKSDDLKDASVMIKSKVKKEKSKESTRRVITIKGWEHRTLILNLKLELLYPY